jgi:hypothetical protein
MLPTRAGQLLWHSAQDLVKFLQPDCLPRNWREWISCGADLKYQVVRNRRFVDYTPEEGLKLFLLAKKDSRGQRILLCQTMGGTFENDCRAFLPSSKRFHRYRKSLLPPIYPYRVLKRLSETELSLGELAHVSIDGWRIITG